MTILLLQPTKQRIYGRMYIRLYGPVFGSNSPKAPLLSIVPLFIAMLLYSLPYNFKLLIYQHPYIVVRLSTTRIPKRRRERMDVLIGSGIAAFTIYAAMKWNKSDKEKIQHVFRNVGYKVGDREPKLFKTDKKEKYTLYSYHVPFGLIADEKLNVIEQTLNKPTKITFKNTKLHIKVYNQKLSTEIPYDWLSTDGWNVPVGYDQERLITHDFDKIPHMTVAGMTRNGKSVLLKLIMAHLINNHPGEVEFYILDLKERLEFGPYETLQQVKVVAGNVYESKTALSDVSNQMKKDMYYFRENGYNNVLNANVSKRKFIIVDEGAELVPPSYLEKGDQEPYQYCQRVLSEIARIGGGLGYRLIFATQYPTADTLPREIKQNSDAKISFRLPTEVASRVAIDEKGAEQLTNPGRAIYRQQEKHILQVPFITDEEIQKNLKEWYRDPSGEKNDEGRKDIITFG